ncbi:NUDIX hydrolase [Corynebacterium sp. A21]|uniref:NUDIX hydrolase n=1 Tax=Corynebacterium sp. A21 TaxID=3457318 RepID=UPI003FCF26A2
MNDNTRPRDSGQDSAGAQNPSGAGSDSGEPKRRRRRRRSRRRGSGSGSGTTQRQSSGTEPGAAESTSQGEPNTAKSSTGETPPKRRSRRRSGSPKSSANKQGRTQPPEDTTTATATATERSDAESKNRGRRRGTGGRNRRTGGRNQPGQGAAGRRPARNQQRGGAAHSRMQTRDETSAGGLVVSGLAEAVNETNDVDLSRIYVALIGRLDRRGRLLWSMPKGHVEPGEAQDSTAEREVWEETGIHGEVFADLGVIDYWFVSEGSRIHKTVHHHLLRYVDGDLNDEDPEVTEVSWIPVSELIEHLAYADERKLARIAHDLLPELARKEKSAGRATPR